MEYYRRWLVGACCCLALTVSSGAAQTKTAPKIALTFDDLPEIDGLAPGMTRLSIIRSIIHALQAAHAPTTYGFLNAQLVVDEPELISSLRAWRAAGFLLGNHTYSHADFNQTTLPAFEREVTRNEPLLRRLMAGEDWRWFRYPYLYEGDTLAKRNGLRAYLSNRGYRVAQVTLDFQDYDWNDPYVRCATKRDQRSIAWLKQMYLDSATEAIRIGRERSRKVYGRDISHVMLLHDGAIEAVMLPQLLELLHQQGFQLVTLPEAESDPAYAIDPGVALKLGGTLPEQMMEAKGIEDGPFRDTPVKELDSICR
ncbi:polysaccharide deacetylase family protein [Granulicella sp. WH15]|nr:polysaccharide deacetylase family protein [Granulicella sp. WH15]